MKKFLTVMCMVSALSVAGCTQSAMTNDKSWDPIASGRTAGSVGVEAVKPRPAKSADKSFDSSLRK